MSDLKYALEAVAKMVCDPENQPHQWVGDYEGFVTYLMNEIGQNL